ncbi:MAG: hypothetical protein H6925_04580 [Holosporaceae bacterium]|nr:MAG: hypothetical protein H6925_04580 [Holosporaceae bacterium]
MALALGIMWGSPAAHAMFESENSLNRPHTSQAGPDLAQYKAMFDTRYDVNTTDLTTQQFFRLSSLAQAYENKTKKKILWHKAMRQLTVILSPQL